MQSTVKKTATILTFCLLSFTQLAFFCGFAILTPNSTTNYNFEIYPGQSDKASFQLYNDSDNPISVNLYGADAIPASPGVFAAKSAQQQELTVGKWLQFSSKNVNLNPQEKKEVEFQMVVPDKTPPGTYAGAIAVETQKNENEKTQTAGMSLVPIIRTIVPVYLKIPGTEKNAYEWSGFSYDTKNGPELSVEVKNTGNTIIGYQGEIDIQDLSLNQIVQTQQIDKSQLYQNDDRTFSFKIDRSKIKSIVNKYKATANITFSQIDIKTGQNTTQENLNKKLEFEIDDFEIVYIIIGSFLAVTAILITIIIHKKTVKKNAKTYTVAENETIEMIAQKEKVPWKKIARLNKLHAPYSVKTGQNILIPKSKK